MGSRLDDIANRLRTVGARAYGSPTAQEAAQKNAETARAVQDGFSEISERFEVYDAIIRAVAAKSGVTVDDVAPQQFKKDENPRDSALTERLRKMVSSVLDEK